jgi:hypothetical protein
MPKKYWRNLPEAELIPTLLPAAPHRVEMMMKRVRPKLQSQMAMNGDPRPHPKPPA